MPIQIPLFCGCIKWLMGSSLPDEGLNPGCWQWKHGIPPGNSHPLPSFNSVVSVFLSSLYILNAGLLLNCKYFLPFCGLLFDFLDGIVCSIRVFIFIKSNISFFCCLCFWCHTSETVYNQRSWRFTLMFSWSVL